MEQGDEFTSRVTYDDLQVVTDDNAIKSLGPASFPIYQSIKGRADMRRLDMAKSSTSDNKMPKGLVLSAAAVLILAAGAAYGLTRMRRL